MKNLNLVFVFALLSGTLLAAPAPLNSEKFLWEFTGRTNAAPHICMTTKNPPNDMILCFGQVGSKGFAIKRNDRQENLAKFKITPVGKWTHLYRTTQYVANTDFYTRTLKITDERNASSIITETFAYSDKSDHSIQHILTTSITGNLPDGTSLNLEQGFYFSL
jgi:hypothetical protein